MRDVSTRHRIGVHQRRVCIRYVSTGHRIAARRGIGRACDIFALCLGHHVVPAPHPTCPLSSELTRKLSSAPRYLSPTHVLCQLRATLPQPDPRA
eukprot:248711-Rhodomonas_salina.1